MPESPPSIRWTPEQLLGITTAGRSLLVSAAAGSGKTAMLAARCAWLVCDAPEPCEIDQLLVVTFTEAAAAEMKARIHAALRDRAARSASRRLERQVALIDRAAVSTLHSFCARLLREHFHAVGLDPAFAVLDGQEAVLLRREVARSLFDDRYEEDDDGAFQTFIDAFGDGDDSALIGQVIRIHEMLRSLVDPPAWLERSRARIDEAARHGTAGSLGRELAATVARALTDLRTRCDAALDQVRRLERFPAYEETLEACSKVIREWTRCLAQDGLDALGEEVRLLKHPPLPRVAAGADKDLAKRAVDSVRDGMTKGALADLLRFTDEQWRLGMAAVRPYAGILLSLVEDFGRRYDLAKSASRVVDFSDLERLALQVLRDSDGAPSVVARGCHARYAHVLVDEYQDINELQDELLRLLSRECLSDRPGNLFCVGDVKQSIYRFRLAEPGRFLDRQKRFRRSGVPSGGRVIDLQSNFRSRAPLLAAINGVFERLMTAETGDIEYDLSHRLHPGLEYPPADGCYPGAPIELHVLPAKLQSPEDAPAEDVSADREEPDRAEREAVLIARTIRELVGMDGSPPMSVIDRDSSGAVRARPVRFGDIVVLLRSMRFKSRDYADVLQRMGVPVHVRSAAGYFESTEMRDMLALLSVLDNRRQDIPLAAVLRGPFANLPEPENALARVRAAFPADGDNAVPFHDAVIRYAAEKSDDLANALREVLARLDRWRVLARTRPPAELIRDIYERTGYPAFCAGLHDGPQRVANLKDLHERAAQFGTFRRQGLSRFLRFLESLRDETDAGRPATASQTDDVVRVMSVHGAKGLEFPVVFLPDLGRRINFDDCRGSILADRAAGLGMSVVDPDRMIRYPSLSSVIVRQRLRRQALTEELRVLYVAMTRARERLILIGTADEKQADGWPHRCAGLSGPFPADMILGAKTMLDWLGPVAAADESAIRAIRHTREQAAALQSVHAARQELSPRQRRLANLEPLDPPPARDETADRIIAELEFRYPFERFTRLGAARAVTRMNESEPRRVDLPMPRFMTERVSAADIGTATHRALLHLDFAQACDSADLADQLARMTDLRLLTGSQAACVDREALAWFLASDLGRLLREHPRDIRREVPVHFRVDQEPSNDPMDGVMIRGRIDLLLPLPDGAILIDWKTDDIPADAVARRAEAHEEQMRQYRSVIQRMTGRPVAAAHLVFLGPRVIRSIGA